MRQVLFDRAGGVHVDEVPAPAVAPGCVLIRVAHSVISTGTETMGYARGGVASEVAGNPALVSKVLDRARDLGVRGAVDQVRERMNERRPQGYSGSGVVVEVGDGVTGLQTGTRVAYGGEPHGEFVCARARLVAPVPGDVPLDTAAFTTIGSIALHGLRLAELQLGESVVVLGLGLVGQLTVALARSMGLRVAGGDPIASRTKLAESFGLELSIDPTDPAACERAVLAWTDGVGADAVLVCAGTESSAPTRLAAELCRDRGALIVVGAAGLELERPPLFRKELRFQVSRSYGPGRYDPSYEDRGHDYPIGYVRWTENRNFRAFLAQLARGTVRLEPLMQRRFPLERAADAYAALKAGSDAPLTALLDVGAGEAEAAPVRTIVRRDSRRRSGELRIGLIGCGSFARSMILPALRAAGSTRIAAVGATTGTSASNVGRLVDAEYTTTDSSRILEDESIDAVVIATRHDSHHTLALGAARAGKPFHVEKPLALTAEQAREIVDAVASAGIPAVVGFNRRSAPFTEAMRGWLERRSGPLQLSIRVNAGSLPPDHWTLDPAVGGGRLVGEGCHFVDLAAYLAGDAGTVVAAACSPDARERGAESNTALTLRFADGSIALVHYYATGSRALAKERIEASWDGASVVIDDWRQLETFGIGRSERSKTQDKGIRAHFRNFLAAVRGEADVIAPVTAGLEAALRIEEARVRFGDDSAG